MELRNREVTIDPRYFAIAAVLGTAPLNEVQPGLFEQRALRDSARLARRQIEIRDELDRSVLAAESAASISAGTPFLVLRLTSR